MPRLVFALLCHDVLTDQASNTVSYIRVIEAGAVAAVPGMLPPLYVCSLWELDPARPGEGFRVRVSCLKPQAGGPGVELPRMTEGEAGRQGLACGDNRPPAEVLATLEVPRTTSRHHRVNLRLPGLPVREAGRHAVIVECEHDGVWCNCAELPVQVTLRQAQAGQGPGKAGPGSPAGQPGGEPGHGGAAGSGGGPIQ